MWTMCCSFCYWFQLLEIIDKSEYTESLKHWIHTSILFSPFSDASTHTATQTHRYKYVNVFPLYLCFFIFIVLCSRLAPLDINQGRNDGAILKTHPQTHTLVHGPGFSSAPLWDWVVCSGLIGANTTWWESKREAEGFLLFVFQEKLARNRIVDVEDKTKQRDVEVMRFYK